MTAPTTLGAYLDSRHYTDARVLDLDLGHVLPDSWAFAGDVSELTRPGDYVTVTVGYEPILVVRAEEGIRAYANVCPHRGSTLLQGVGHCGHRIECPYHGWRFTLGGSLTGVPHRPRLDRDPTGLGLAEVRVAVWGRFVFVNPSGGAPPLTDCLEELPGVLAAHDLEATEVVHRSTEHVLVNWKLWADIGFDSYHLPVVHRDTIGRGIELRDIRMVAGPLYTSYGYVDGDAGRSVFAYLYPGFHVSAEPDGTVLIASDVPDGPDRIVIQVAIYAPPGSASGFADGAMIDGAIGELYRRVRREDVDQCARLAVALRSRAPVPGPVSELSLPEVRFHHWLRHMYRRHAAAGRALGVPAELLDPGANC